MERFYLTAAPNVTLAALRRLSAAALNHLRSQGTDTKPEDVARLSPLADKHFNVLGRYHFTVTDSILRGELRPLRVPDAPEELFWAVGA